MKTKISLIVALWIFAVSSALAATPHSGTLPVLHINTENNQEITSKEYYINASWYLESNGFEGVESIGSASNPQEVEIKARGNYTWSGFDKKPYKLKFPKKLEFLGMDKNKHFALLAHADDNLGFMRNLTGFEISRRLGLDFTPADLPVELYLNGDYKGLYFATQTIRIDKTRVNITEQADLAEEGVDGGWLVEIDNYDTDPHVTIMEPTGYPIYFTYKSPEVLSTPQLNYLTDQVTAINDAIYISDKNSTEWENLIDIESAARFYIVQEIMDDCESYHGSCYIYKDKGEDAKWHFGPVWDFGNSFMRGSKSAFIWKNPTFNQTWIGELYKYPKFQEKVKEVWADFVANNFDGLYDYIRNYADKINAGALSDYNRWNQYGHRNVVEKAETMCDNVRKSVNWLGGQWGTAPAPEPVETDVYVRGTFNNWSLSHKMQYNKDNGTYLISGIDFEGAFKIASEDWKAIDFGVEIENTVLPLEQEIPLMRKGKNMIAPQGIKDYTLILDPEKETLLLTNTSGVSDVEADKNEIPEIYTITGHRVIDTNAKGIYLLRYSNKVVKVIK